MSSGATIRLLPQCSLVHSVPLGRHAPLGVMQVVFPVGVAVLDIVYLLVVAVVFAIVAVVATGVESL